MTPNTLRAYIVVLSFEPPGPVHASTWIAPDAPSAAAMAAINFMRSSGTDANLMACLTAEMPAEQLRHMLRAVEGKLPDSGNAEVLSLVPREAPLDAADASTFTGPAVDRLWAQQSVRAHDYGEEFGPPAPWFIPGMAPGAVAGPEIDRAHRDNPDPPEAA